jgi:hypothetical protein
MSFRENGDTPIGSNSSADRVCASECTTNVVALSVGWVESDNQVPSIISTARPMPNASPKIAKNLAAR